MKKQIEELADGIFVNCQACLLEEEAEMIAKYVIEEMGYRRASEVAREIFEAIYGISIGCSVENDVMRLALEKEPYVIVVLASAFDKLRKKYIGEDTNVTTKESEGGE